MTWRFCGTTFSIFPRSVQKTQFFERQLLEQKLTNANQAQNNAHQNTEEKHWVFLNSIKAVCGYRKPKYRLNSMCAENKEINFSLSGRQCASYSWKFENLKKLVSGKHLTQKVWARPIATSKEKEIGSRSKNKKKWIFHAFAGNFWKENHQILWGAWINWAVLHLLWLRDWQVESYFKESFRRIGLTSKN